MSDTYEDPFSLDGILPAEDAQLPKLRVPVKIEAPFDEDETPKHKVERSCADRKVHTSSRLKKTKAAKPAGPPKVKGESKGHGGKRVKGSVNKESWQRNDPDVSKATNDAIADRRAKSMDVAKRIIAEAIRQATFTISEEFVRTYGKSFKAMKKDMIDAIQSGAAKAKIEVIKAIEESTVSSAHFKQE